MRPESRIRLRGQAREGAPADRAGGAGPCPRPSGEERGVVRKTTRGAARRGLTLIEMLITIAVLSLAVALVIPSMDQAGVLRVQAAVRQIASDIAAAQTEAMAYQERRALYFGAVPAEGGGALSFTEGNGYVLVQPGAVDLEIGNLQTYSLWMPEAPAEPYARNFDDRTRYGGAVIVESDFDGSPVLMFDELGGPIDASDTDAPGSGGTVLIEAPQYGVTYRLTVAAMTGRVTVELVEDEPEPEDDAEPEETDDVADPHAEVIDD